MVLSKSQSIKGKTNFNYFWFILYEKVDFLRPLHKKGNLVKEYFGMLSHDGTMLKIFGTLKRKPPFCEHPTFSETI